MGWPLLSTMMRSLTPAGSSLVSMSMVVTPLTSGIKRSNTFSWPRESTMAAHSLSAGRPRTAMSALMLRPKLLTLKAQPVFSVLGRLMV